MFLLLAIISFGGAAVVRWWMMRTYTKWQSVPNAVGANGERVARHILDTNGLHQVRLEVSPGQLSDHYIPSQKRIRLSESINSEASVAAIAVAAHEVGHALQDAEGYGPLKLKALLMPVAAVGNQLGLLLAVGGGVMGATLIANIGMAMVVAGILMQLLTLPIEFDASKRALQQLTQLNLVDQQDYDGAKQMLRAAALTYVAGAASSLAFVGLLAIRFLRR